MLSVLQHARRVFQEEKSLVVLCFEESFVYFTQRYFELPAWGKKGKKLD